MLATTLITTSDENSTAWNSLSTQNFVVGIQLFKATGLIHLIVKCLVYILCIHTDYSFQGIYPTIIIILVALSESYIERTVKYDQIPTPHISDLTQAAQIHDI